MTDPTPLNLPEGALQFLYSTVVRDRRHQAVELAVERGWLTRAQGDEALADSRPGPLGAGLVDRGWIVEEQRAELERELERRETSRAAATRAIGRLPDAAAKALETPANSFGRYILIGRLGQGAMGAVWKAWDRDLGRWVALKILHAESIPAVQERFLREARAAAKVRHPNLVTVYDAGEHEGRPFLSMELIDGAPLDVQAPLPSVVAAIRKVALALEAAHRDGIVHRDLKPGNIMMDGAGEPHVVDFGLAHFDEELATLTRTGSALGTPAYMAPEQVESRPGAISPRTDVYALGAILYEAATGQRAARGSSTAELFRNILGEEPAAPRRIRPSIPRDLETIILKSLEKNPARRYAGAAELAADLGRHLNGEPIEAVPASTIRRILRRGYKHRAVLLPALGAALVAVIAGGWTWRTRTENARRADAEQEALRLIETLRPVLAEATECLYRGDDDFEAVSRRAEEASRTIDRAIDLAPRLATAHYLRGQVQDFLGHEERAEAAWRRTLEIDPAFGPACFQVARLLLYRAYSCFVGTGEMRASRRSLAPGLTLGARDLLRQAVARKSGFDDRLQLDLAQALLAYSEDRKETFRELCHKAIGEQGKSRGIEDFHWLLGTVAWPGQLDHLNDALAIRPKHPWALYTRSAVRGDNGDKAGELVDLAAAVKLRPRNAHFRALLGSLLMNAGRYAESIAACTVALELDPRSCHALVIRAGSRMASGDRAGAATDLEAALGLQPSEPAAYLARAHLRNLEGDLRAAIVDYTRAIDLNGALAAAWSGRAVARGLLEDLAGAEGDFSAALALDPKDFESWQGRGTARLRLERREEAVADYSECLKLNPDHAEALLYRGAILVDAGKIEEGRKDVERARDLTKPSDPVHGRALEALKLLPPKRDF